jgi:hypothetical protein
MGEQYNIKMNQSKFEAVNLIYLAKNKGELWGSF